MLKMHVAQMDAVNQDAICTQGRCKQICETSLENEIVILFQCFKLDVNLYSLLVDVKQFR